MLQSLFVQVPYLPEGVIHFPDQIVLVFPFKVQPVQHMVFCGPQLIQGVCYSVCQLLLQQHMLRLKALSAM